MNERKYVLDESGTHLRQPTDREEFKDGLSIVRVVLPNGETHLIAKTGTLDYAVQEDGTLAILIVGRGGAVREYGQWLYVEQQPYKQRPAVRAVVV